MYAQNIGWGCGSALEKCTNAWRKEYLKFQASLQPGKEQENKHFGALFDGTVTKLGCGIARDDVAVQLGAVLVCNYFQSNDQTPPTDAFTATMQQSDGPPNPDNKAQLAKLQRESSNKVLWRNPIFWGSFTAVEVLKNATQT